MAVRKVMIIRHAEKPPKAGPPPHGVDIDGVHSPDQLTPKGWQRAGALVSLFAPLDQRPVRAPLERPTAIFAAGRSETSPSLRPQSTVEPTASALGASTPITVLPAPGDEPEAARRILECSAEVCLVCWEHKKIKDLVAEITGGIVRAPRWDGTRYDVVFVLTRTGTSWAFKEVPQRLLPSDVATSVSFAADRRAPKPPSILVHPGPTRCPTNSPTLSAIP